MSIGLRSRETKKFLCHPPGQPEIFADHDAIDRCGQINVKDEGSGEVSLQFDESRKYLCIPDPPNAPNFEIRDKVGPWERFALAADRKSVSRAGRTIDLVGYELPQPASIHLEKRGPDFVDKDGKRIVLVGLDGFDDLWFRTQGRESELDALMKESQELKVKVRRIWCMGDAGENQVFSLYPQSVNNYFDQLRSLVPYENSYGVVPLFTAFVDAQRVMPPSARLVATSSAQMVWTAAVTGPAPAGRRPRTRRRGRSGRSRRARRASRAA